jgi:hypothetical protein
VTFVLTFFLAFCLTYVLIWQSFWPSVWHVFRSKRAELAMRFGSRFGPLHPELAKEEGWRSCTFV